MGRGLDDDLLPDRAPRVLVDVVDLIENHPGHPLQGEGVVVDQVAKDLGGHHHHLGEGPDRGLAGDQADAVLAVAPAEVTELLVGEGLEGGGVEDALAAVAAFETAPDHPLRDYRLAAGGGSADQYPLMTLQGRDGLHLEGVEPKRQRALERFQPRSRQALLRVAQAGGDSLTCCRRSWGLRWVHHQARISSGTPITRTPMAVS